MTTEPTGPLSLLPLRAGEPLSLVKMTTVFSASGPNGAELWRTDGTAAGTIEVRDIRTGPLSSRLDLRFLAVIGSVAYFVADNGTHGFELWRTDGTTPGTRMVQDIHPSGSAFPYQLTVLGGRLYFSANSGLGAEPFVLRQNGSIVSLGDLRPGALGSAPEGFAAVPGLPTERQPERRCSAI